MLVYIVDRTNAPVLTVSEADQAGPTISIAPPLPAVAAQNMLRIGTNGNNNGGGNTWAAGTIGAGMNTMTGTGGTIAGFGTTAMGIGRDPKARARSRDYLKQLSFLVFSLIYLSSRSIILANVICIWSGVYKRSITLRRCLS